MVARLTEYAFLLYRQQTFDLKRFLGRFVPRNLRIFLQYQTVADAQKTCIIAAKIVCRCCHPFGEKPKTLF
jgi:hypothetical protein